MNFSLAMGLPHTPISYLQPLSPPLKPALRYSLWKLAHLFFLYGALFKTELDGVIIWATHERARGFGSVLRVCTLWAHASRTSWDVYYKLLLLYMFYRQELARRCDQTRLPRTRVYHRISLRGKSAEFLYMWCVFNESLDIYLFIVLRIGYMIYLDNRVPMWFLVFYISLDDGSYYFEIEICREEGDNTLIWHKGIKRSHIYKCIVLSFFLWIRGRCMWDNGSTL